MTIQEIEEKLKALSAKEIIMAMVNGLRNRHTEIDMSSFGKIVGQVFFGCAATNCIIEITKLKPEEEIRISCENYSELFVKFESAIDYLRKGGICGFNSIWDYAQIVDPYIYLPTLENYYTEEQLQKYVELAEYQH